MVRLVKSDSPRVRSYFSRREQWRLLLLVFAFGVVVILMREVRRPETVARLTHAFSGGDAVAAAPDQAAAPAATTSTSEPHLPELSPAALATIRDNTYFRTDEKDAWFALISILQRTPAAELAARSVGEVGYAQLVQQPQTYRGKVVTVRGTVRQVTAERPAANELGLETYFRLVIQPSGGEIWPIFVYCLELPDDFPRGEDVAVDVTATGIFFKNLSYQWKDGVGVAPIVLAMEVTRVDATTSPAQTPAAPPRSPVTADQWQAPNVDEVVKPDQQAADLQQLLSLAGWDAERLATFTDDKPLSPEQRLALIQLLWRVRTFDSASIAAWTHKDVSIAAIAAKPDEYRGQFMRFNGRVQRLASHPLSAADAERLEMPRYYECDLALDQNAGTVTILATRVPQSWQDLKRIDEPASVTGLFIQRLSSDGGRPQILLVAQQVAAETFGRSVLATLGMDAGLLDGIRNHQPIRSSESEAFYRLLAAVNEVGVRQLIRFAQQNVGLVAQSWAPELESADLQRRMMAQEVERRAAEGHYSVAPLFNDADRQIGQLIVVDGIARRIVRVDASSGSEGGANEVAQRLGIDHYYEMDVFTGDSQNRPLVFCVRELPAGMPTGGDLHEPVRLAGFFFKSWRYRTRDAGQGEDEGAAADPLGKTLIAPLLIGRGPVRIELEGGGGHVAELVGGGLFVLALIGIWATAWWFARGDRQFRARTMAASFSLPAGESLDELNVPAVGEPMNIVGRSATDTHNSP